MSKNENPKEKRETIVELGKFYFLNGKYEQAMREFNKALEINPKDADIYYHMGLICESRNKRDEAQDAYEQALEYDSKHFLARKHLNHLIGIDEDKSS